MAVTPTKLSLYNGALRIIKHRPLATTTDDVEARYLLDDEYEQTLAWCLEQGLWNHASRMVEIEASEDEEPLFGLNYAFDKPSDYVRLVKISASPYLYPTLEDLQYIEEGDYWFSSVNPLYVQYVSNDDAYGGSFGLWPQTYTLFVQHELAARVAPHLGSFSANELDQIDSKRDRALKDARSKDAMGQGAQRPPPGRLTQSRGRGLFGGNNGRPYWR